MYHRDIPEERAVKLTTDDLGPLGEIQGVLGAGIYTGEGETLVSWTREKLDFVAVGANAAELYRQAKQVAGALQIGLPTFIELHTDQSKIYCHYCVFPGELGLGVLADHGVNIGMLRFTMKKVTDQLKSSRER